MKILYGCIVLLILSVSPVFALEYEHGVPDSLVQQADSLYDHFEGEEALRLYNRIIDKDSTYYPAWWKSSLLYARIGHRFESVSQQKKYYKQSLEHARQALDLRPDKANSHFVMGVALGRKALIAGPRERVAASRAIKKHAEMALRVDTMHAGAHHLLGRWHMEVTDLNFAERMAANWLFGGLPEGSSLKRAVKHLRRATEINPDFILYWYDLGRALHRRDQEQKALRALRKAIQMQPKTPSGKEDQQKARQLYNSIK